ncbi:MAG: tyrosine-type recombinase/integrase [Gammaproteobacteria bacterium]
MALTKSKLQVAIADAKATGTRKKVADAHGLYALAAPVGAVWWRLRLLHGAKEPKELHLSLGTWPETPIDDAVNRAATVRKASKNGEDPRLVAAQLRGAVAPHPVQAAPAGDSIESVVARWREHTTGDHAASTLKRNDRCIMYLVEELGPSTSMAAVDAPALQAAIERIELKHSGRTYGSNGHVSRGEIPRRSLQLANKLWRYAMGKRIVPHNPASGLRADDFLKKRVERSMAAITDPKKFGALLRAIDGYDGEDVTRIALRLLALTFVRPGELRNAKWSEFDLDTDVPQWVIPRERMKTRASDHVVPLSAQAVALLRELHQYCDADGVLAFPGPRSKRPLSDATFTVALRALGVSGDEQTAHGFRASASSMLHARGVNHDVIEQQLAHKRPGVAGIYNRAHLLPERRAMMQRWADYLDELRITN